MECKPCRKTFTGQVSYDQHMQSEKHKKKILSIDFPNSQSGAFVSDGGRTTAAEPEYKEFYCDICNMAFNSLEDFRMHSLSQQHAEKVLSRRQESSLNSNIVSSSSIMNQRMNGGSEENKPLDKSEMLLVELNDCRVSGLTSYRSCELCAKNFSGPEPYKQHMDSAVHKKKVEMQKNLSAINPNLTSSSFECKPCKKFFSGYVPYMQHMTSEIHKRRLQNLQAFEQFASQVDSVPGMAVTKQANGNMQPNENIAWFCDVCNKQCSGYLPYQQHLNGASHLKNVNKAKMQNAYKTSIVDPSQSVQQFNENSTENTAYISQSKKDRSQYLKIQEGDYLLPELAEKMRVLTTEELEESIEIFLPDEEVDFDQVKAKEIDSNNKKNGTNDSLEEIEVEEALLNETKMECSINKICDLCNVQLYNLDDALNHFESIEHYNKKWRSN